MASQPRALTVLTIVSVVLFLGALWMVFVFAPLEAIMNYVQKIFYFHIANAWVGMLGFMAAAVSGILYLVKKDLKWDLVELAAVEISLVFFSITIVSGSIWARPSWGTWWTWDPRLTTAAVQYRDYRAAMNTAVAEVQLRQQMRRSQIADVIESVLAGKGIQGFQDYVGQLQEVKQNDLQEAAKRVFKIERSVAVRIHGKSLP